MNATLSNPGGGSGLWVWVVILILIVAGTVAAVANYEISQEPDLFGGGNSGGSSGPGCGCVLGEQSFFLPSPGYVAAEFTATGSFVVSHDFELEGAITAAYPLDGYPADVYYLVFSTSGFAGFTASSGQTPWWEACVAECIATFPGLAWSGGSVNGASFETAPIEPGQFYFVVWNPGPLGQGTGTVDVDVQENVSVADPA